MKKVDSISAMSEEEWRELLRFRGDESKWDSAGILVRWWRRLVDRHERCGGKWEEFAVSGIAALRIHERCSLCGAVRTVGQHD